MCTCRWITGLLALAIILFEAVWPSKWVVVIAAALILIHELAPCKCHTCSWNKDMDEKEGKQASKRKRRR